MAKYVTASGNEYKPRLEEGIEVFVSKGRNYGIFGFLDVAATGVMIQNNYPKPLVFYSQQGELLSAEGLREVLKTRGKIGDRIVGARYADGKMDFDKGYMVTSPIVRIVE